MLEKTISDMIDGKKCKFETMHRQEILSKNENILSKQKYLAQFAVMLALFITNLANLQLSTASLPHVLYYRVDYERSLFLSTPPTLLP